MIRTLLLVLFITCNYVYAQQSVTGVVVDASDKKALVNAAIVILDTDSIMQGFARAGKDGKFELKQVKAGKHLLIVSYPKFEVFSKQIQVGQGGLKLDSIKISSQANILEEVIVTQKIPIKIKGDTIEYNASSFETEKNAKLEDLLRRLPGVTVSNTGEITAQGKTVSKVLIDGEEFFGYDPKIAIRNVRADAVDKVQVYERKSDQAELTGVDDGVRLQTVNVVLKNEARVGVFGNANVNFGTNKLFDANLFTAKFDHSERIGVTGSWNNMGNSSDASMIRMNNQIIGKPTHNSAGVNYENNFLQKKLNLTSSYGYSNNGNANESDSYNKQVLDENETQETNRQSQSSSDKINHSLRAQVRMRVDSASNLQVQINGTKGSGDSRNSSSSETLRSVGDNVNTKANDFTSDNSAKTKDENLDFRINYRRRLNKSGRSMNLQLSNQFTNSESTNLVREITNKYDSLGVNPRTTDINQTRFNEGKNNKFGASLNISEPITKDINLTLGYSFDASNRTGLVNAFNNTGNTQQLDSLYSKNEQDKFNNNGLDFNISFRTDKFMVNLSNKTTYLQQNLSDSYRNIALDRSFWQNNFVTRFSYKISNTKSLSLDYQNGSNVPSFSQLQPIQPPTNELFVQLGNPDLKRETLNSFNINYNKFSLLKASSLMVNATIAFTDNAIVNKSEIDQTGKTTATFVNINDKTNWNVRLNASYGKPIIAGLIQFGPTANLTYANNYLYINGKLNQNNTTNALVGFNASKQTSKIVDFFLNFNIGLTNEKNSVQSQFNNTSLRSTTGAELKYFLPFKFSLTQALNYSYTGKTKIFPEPIQQFYMNLELTRKLLPSESLLLSVKAFDVFNSYNNTQRSFSNSNYSETRQQLLSQYFMLGLKWDFNKYLGKKND
ncbi:outer membrane beta-barrel protein [Sphingobacterium sp. MYb382]|uniref:outer membrane beta-barrel protein n=1 Tax=Sphingobacterium sp. MYb382 TaxID=2745278 RepID=UPI00309CE584